MVQGRTPKPDGEAANRNPRVIDTTYLDWDGKVRGPELPEGVSFHKQTVLWWQHWRESPQAIVFADADWDELLMAAFLVDAVWRDKGTRGGKMSIQGKVQAIAQIRRTTAEFGATFGDRLRLRMKIRTDFSDKEYEDSVSQDAAEVIDYMELLNKKAAETKKESS